MNTLKRYHNPDDRQTMNSSAAKNELGAPAAAAPAYGAHVMAQTGTEAMR